MKFIQKLTVFLVLCTVPFSVNLRAMDAEKAYGLLKVKKGATDKKIESAYRKLSINCHPDKNKSPEASEKFIELGEAKECLLRELENEQKESAKNDVIDNTWRIINEKKEELTFYDLIGVSANANAQEVKKGLENFRRVWCEFGPVIESMIAPDRNYAFACNALASALTIYRKNYDAYLALPYEQKLTHEKYRPYWHESFSTCYSLKKEAKAIAKESLVGLAGGVAASAVYLGLSALTRNHDCIKTLPAVFSFYGYTTLAAGLGTGIGMNIQRSKSWTSLLGIGTRVLIFGAVTKFSAKYVEAGLKWASII